MTPWKFHNINTKRGVSKRLQFGHGYDTVEIRP